MKRLTKKTLLVSLIVGVSAVAVVGGSALALTLSGRGVYTTMDNGYYLERQDAVASYSVNLPSVTNVSAYSRLRSSDMTTEETILTYQYSEPGSENNWDIYMDEAGNRYTYHGITGQLVSILYNQDAVSDMATLSSDTAVAKADVVNFSDNYLESIVPGFDEYELVSYEENLAEGEVSPAYRYILQYGLPIGDYFLGDRITLCFNDEGSLIDATFPKNSEGNTFTSEGKQQLSEKLPTDDQLLEIGTQKMQEKYGDDLVSVEMRNVVLREGDTGTGYELEVALGVRSALPDGIKVSQLETFVYSID